MVERRRLMLLVLATAVPPAVEAAVLRGFGFQQEQRHGRVSRPCR